MTKKVFLITGGSRGIGAAIAEDAGRAGYHVLLTYAERAAAAEEVVSRIHAAGGRATAFKADAGVPAEIERLYEKADDLGTLAAMVYNGGITGPSSPLADASDDTLRRVLDVNLLGALLCSRAAVHRMSTTRGGAGGSIVLLSSRATVYGSVNEHVWYAASKGGIDVLTIGLAREVASQGIRVNAVSPGPISTEIHVPGKLERIASGLPMQRAGEPAEVSAAVMFLVSDAASYVTGANLAVAGGR